MKLAPALEAVLAWPPPYAKTGVNAALVSVQAKRELRALLRLARAAGRAHQGWPDGECIVELELGSCPVCNALRTLDRASGRGERGSGR
jgi:hypothetical protein